MPTMRGLSEEILLTIFDHLSTEDLHNCQKVCRLWYPPSHRLALKNVDLKNANEVEKFVASIDYSPKPSYIKAVKTITIRDLDTTTDETALIDNNGGQANDKKVDCASEVSHSTPFWYNKTNLKRLLARFPNLEEIHVVNSLDFMRKFDIEICSFISRRCSKLKVFDLSIKNYQKSQAQYCEALYKFRQYVKAVDIEQITGNTRFGNVIQFLTNFPHLTKIINSPPQLDTFEKWLPAFEQLRTLTDLTILTTEDDRLSFATNYPKTKTQDEQKQLKRRLSAVEKLYWFNKHGTCLNSLKFIKKYMDGLESIEMNCVFKEPSSDVNQRLFCNTMLGFLRDIADCQMFIQMKAEVILEYLPIVVNTIFFQAGSYNDGSQRFLKIYIDDAPLLQDSAELSIRTNESMESHIQVSVNYDYNMDEIASGLLGKTLPLEDIDEFRLQFTNFSNYKKKVNAEVYTKTIEKMPSVKRLYLELPFSFVESDDVCEKFEKLLFVEEVTIASRSDTNVQPLLDRYCLMFPKLRDLRIFNFCGTWAQNLGELQLALPGYTLEILMISTTSVEEKTQELLGKKKTEKDDFAVLLIETLGDGERFLYKISLHDYKITPIQDKDLKGRIRGEDYLRVHITIRRLKKLRIFSVNGITDLWGSQFVNIK